MLNYSSDTMYILPLYLKLTPLKNAQGAHLQHYLEDREFIRDRCLTGMQNMISSVVRSDDVTSGTSAMVHRP